MRKVVLLVILIAGSFVLAAPARAAESVQVKMTFTETFKECALEDGVCGHGQVIPLGQATETTQFWGGCGGSCDLRTIYLDGATIVAEETFSEFQCPGSCNAQHGSPGSGRLDDVIVGGTGVFEGATGTLTGAVRFAAQKGTVELSGTISYGS
jgi:hypothetical protein